MGKLSVGTFLTLDGVMQAPGAPEEDTEGGFTNGGWLPAYFDENVGRVLMESAEGTDAILFGRKSFNILGSFWPSAPADDPMAQHLNSVKKYVATRTGEIVDWGNSETLEGDAADAVAKLKGRHESISVVGSANLIQTLLANDLVDEFHLFIFPVVVGDGKRLFGDGTMPKAMELVSSETTPTGVTMQVYRRVGDMRQMSVEDLPDELR